MWIIILSGLIVSLDALFIGVALGAQKKCKFWHVLAVNALITALTFVGFGLGIWLGSVIYIDIDIIIGILFILLGLSIIIYHFGFERRKNSTELLPENLSAKGRMPAKNIIVTGVLAAVEAMFITIGMTLVLDSRSLMIPTAVAAFHLIYSLITFAFAKQLRKLPAIVGPIVAGLALIAYGIVALVL